MYAVLLGLIHPAIDLVLIKSLFPLSRGRPGRHSYAGIRHRDAICAGDQHAPCRPVGHGYQHSRGYIDSHAYGDLHAMADLYALSDLHAMANLYTLSDLYAMADMDSAGYSHPLDHYCNANGHAEADLAHLHPVNWACASANVAIF